MVTNDHLPDESGFAGSTSDFSGVVFVTLSPDNVDDIMFLCCPFVWTDLDTTISHERLEQSR